MPRSRRPRHRGKEGGKPAGVKGPANQPLEVKPQGPVFAALKVGQRVRMCEPFRPSGSRCLTGTVTRAGELIDVKWDDGRVSHMMTITLIEPHADEEEPGTRE